MKFRSLIPVVAAIAMLAGCANPQGKKVAIVYYSQTGNTKAVAQIFAETLNSLTDSDNKALFNADLIEIKPEKAYPDTFEATIEESRDECIHDMERAIKNPVVKNFDKYDIVFIGYPVWFGTYAPVIKTFCNANDSLAGKKVVPFCTYGSGGRISSAFNLHTICRNAEIIDSYGISDKRLDQAKGEISVFVASIAKKLLCDGKCDKENAGEACGGQCCKHEADAECSGECGGQCCGAQEYAALSAEDSTLFTTAIEGYDRMELSPVQVKKVEMINATHVFLCQANSPLGGIVNVEVYILAPADGAKPTWTAIER